MKNNSGLLSKRIFENMDSKRVMTIIILFIAVLASIICIKKYLKNSNIISYDFASFKISDGFSSSISDTDLTLFPESQTEEIRDFCVESSFTLLPKGSYSVGITYVSDGFNVAYMQAGDKVYEEILLPAGEQTIFHNFVLDQPVEDARLRVFYNGPGAISIKTMIIEGDGPIVSDWILIFGLIWGCVFAILLYAKIFTERLLTREHIFEISFVVLVAIASIPYLQLLNKGIFWGIDTNVQNMRIEGIKDALIGGQFPVVIAPSMCNGYGSIEPMMYPSLFLYPFALLRILGVSPVLVYKVAHISINLFMCSTCYVCVKRITKSVKASSIALIAFAFSKFHLEVIGTSDSAYGMGIAFIFLFMVIIGTYEIFAGHKESWPYLTIGMWGVMNSHILSALFAAFIVGVVTLTFIKKAFCEDRIKSFVLAVVSTIPLCLYRIYTFLDAFLNNELNTGVLNLHAYDLWVFDFKHFFTEPIAVLTVCVVVIAIIFLVVIRNEDFSDSKRIFVSFLIIDLTCILFMSDVLPWGRMLSNSLFDSIFGYIQYPNRLFQIAIPATVVLIGLMIEYLENSEKAVSNTAMGMIALVVVLSSMFSYKSEISQMRTMENAFTDKLTGDVLSFPGMNDYVPAGENEESYDGRIPYYSNDTVSIDYDSYDKNGVNISCLVSSSENGNYVDFPLFGYKGYVCKDDNGNKYNTGIGEHHRLRVFFDKLESPSYISISYQVPKMYYVLMILSYATLFAIFTFNRSFFGRVKERTKYYQFLKKGVAVDLVKKLTASR